MNNNTKCKKCGKEFKTEVTDMRVPGGKDRENIHCPYCNEINGSVMTSGFVFTEKIKDIPDKKNIQINLKKCILTINSDKKMGYCSDSKVEKLKLPKSKF